ncbi:hypothetical protein [Gramella sp. AN32]|uniref:Uncharacterized protein n=1 Tax=Christiangramia antarctica TaxID=2058158 RepID=A0ABW5X1E4_9FLAO|nr:hypothetical protein [Gramella sp. AN32]MCM4154871.1 hypothetical protein [Gramella sp. AN32]
MNNNLKRVSQKIESGILFLLVLLLFQNCTVYRGTNVTFEQAVNDEVKVRVFTEDGKKLMFKRLQLLDGQSIGFAKKNSQTGKFLLQNGVNFEEAGKFTAFVLDSLEVEEIYPKNRTASTFVSIGIALLVAATTIIVAVAVIFMTSWTG